MWTEAIREWWELFQREIRDASRTTKTKEVASKKRQLRIMPITYLWWIIVTLFIASISLTIFVTFLISGIALINPWICLMLSIGGFGLFFVVLISCYEYNKLYWHTKQEIQNIVDKLDSIEDD